MKRTLIAASMTAALLAAPATAQADPPYVSKADALLQQEIADEQYQPPAWMLEQPDARSYDEVDIAVGILLVVGLVMLW